MGCTGPGCLTVLVMLCGALGDAAGRGKSPVPAPRDDPRARWASMVPREEGAVCGCCSGSGVQAGPSCQPVQAEGLPWPGEGSWGLQLQCVAASVGHCFCLVFCFTLILLKIASRGCPVGVYRCFAEGFVNFWSCICLCKYIYAHTEVCTYICVCECMFVYLCMLLCT